MAIVQDLPNELLLFVFPLVPLKSLISIRGVCQRWRSLVTHAQLYPARRSLLDLYDHAISSPAFLASRPYLLPLLSPFNRNAFIASLPPGTPEEFRLWVLEWPAKAVISWIWPGLESRPPHLGQCRQDAQVSIARRGYNLLGHQTAPRVQELTVIDPDMDFGFINWSSTPASQIFMFPATELWSDIGVTQLSIEVLEICQDDTLFVGISEPLRLILDAGEGGQKLKGSLRHLGLGYRDGFVASGWVEFLKDELQQQDLDFSGERYCISSLFDEDLC